MKKPILLFILILTIFSYSQSRDTIATDSLKTNHKISLLEKQLTVVKQQRDNVVKVSIELQSELKTVKAFKFGRTELQKEEQLRKINTRIKSNQDDYSSLTKKMNALQIQKKDL